MAVTSSLAGDLADRVAGFASGLLRHAPFNIKPCSAPLTKFKKIFPVDEVNRDVSSAAACPSQHELHPVLGLLLAAQARNASELQLQQPLLGDEHATG